MNRTRPFLLAFRLLSACFVFSASCVSMAYADKVTDTHGPFRVYSHKGEALILIPAQGLTYYKTFMLANPPRVVVDIATSVSMHAAPVRFGALVPEIKEIRTRHEENIYRVVCEPAPGVKLVRHGLLRARSAGDNSAVALSLKGSSARSDTDSIASSDVADAAPEPASETVGDFPLTRVSTGNDGAETNAPSPKPKPSAGLPMIVIDAGHGGKDPGAFGRGKKTYYEKDVTLAYARYLAAALERTGRYKARLTRDSDVFLPLQERADIAERLDADFFISLHADSLPGKTETNGLSVYTLSDTASDQEAEKLAQKENMSGGMSQDEAEDDILAALSRLVQRDTLNRSALFAERFVAHVRQEGVNVLPSTHRFAGFRVLTGAKVPSALVELGYLSNHDDLKRLIKDGHDKHAVARGIIRSLDHLFKESAAAMP